MSISTHLFKVIFCFIPFSFFACQQEQTTAKEIDLDAPIGNFKLVDQMGNNHELYLMKDAKAIVLYIQGNACPIVRNAIPDLKKVREIYSPKGVRFLLLNANPQDNAETISKEATEFNIDFPILVDESQVAGKLLQLRRTAEAIVINPTTWKVVYRGPVNDRIAYESQKPDATNNYLADALDAQLKGELPEKRQRKSKGCLIKFKN